MVKKTGSRSAATKPTPHQALATDQHQIALATPASATPVQAAADMLGNFPIVGIGASAGGLAAFESFFLACLRC
jgi:chemotaxis response regulator CheB